MASTSQKFFIGCLVTGGGFMFLIAVLIVAYGLAIESGRLPDSGAIPAGKISPHYTKKLRAAEVIGPDEKILYFYSRAIASILNDGNMFTNKKVITYVRTDGTMDLSSATFEEIDSIDFQKSESWVEDSSITINMTNGDWFVLYVGTEGGGDQSFYDKLMDTWKAKKGAE